MGSGKECMFDRKSKSDSGKAALVAKGKDASSNVTCREMIIRLDDKSRHR